MDFIFARNFIMKIALLILKVQLGKHMLMVTIKYTHSKFYLQMCLEETVMPTCGSEV